MLFQVKVKFESWCEEEDLDLEATFVHFDNMQEMLHVYTRDNKEVKHYSFPMTYVQEYSVKPIYENNRQKVSSC